MAACFRCSTTHDFLDKVAKRIDKIYIELNIHNQESNYQPLFILKFVSLSVHFLIIWMANLNLNEKMDSFVVTSRVIIKGQT